MHILNGISFPFRIGGRGGVVSGDSVANKIESVINKLRENIAQILGTEPGERIMEPEFGCRLLDIIFEPLDITLISLIRFRMLNALTRWEPRIVLSAEDIIITTTDSSVDVEINFTAPSLGIGDPVLATMSYEKEVR